MFRLSGAVSVWTTTLERGQTISPQVIKWILLLSPIVIAASQYLCEMTNKRLKLTLHLPHSEFKIICAMQLFGLCATALINATILIPLWLGLQISFPREIINAEIIHLLPYCLGGVTSYLLTAWIIVEPIAKRRIINLLIGAATLSIFAINAPSPLSYIYATPLLIVIALLAWFCALYSAARFKNGAQE